MTETVEIWRAGASEDEYGDPVPGTLVKVTEYQARFAPNNPAEPVERQTKATVTQASPLRVVVDGAQVDSPANALDGATYAVGTRLTASIRNPQPPLVAGEET